MEDEMMKRDKDMYPDVLVKIRGGLYSINSRYINSIMQMEEYNRVPGAPEGILGIINFRGRAIPVMDLRTIFGLPSLAKEFKDFKQMLEEREQDHIVWVETLKESVEEKRSFPLTTDPHKCKLGKWYDNFSSDSSVISMHLKKMEEPHRKLHEAAIEVERCLKDESQENEEICIHSILRKIEEEYKPAILSILEESKEVFKNAYSEMLIVLGRSDKLIGVVVDEVLSVEELSELEEGRSDIVKFGHTDLVTGVKIQEGCSELILELDDNAILDHTEDIEGMQAEVN